MLNLCGYEIWPPTHNDPTIKGPQPRIISKRQADAMRAMAEIKGDEAVTVSLKHGKALTHELGWRGLSRLSLLEF